jgi:hypothetical protein
MNALHRLALAGPELAVIARRRHALALEPGEELFGQGDGGDVDDADARPLREDLEDASALGVRVHRLVHAIDEIGTRDPGVDHRVPSVATLERRGDQLPLARAERVDVEPRGGLASDTLPVDCSVRLTGHGPGVCRPRAVIAARSVSTPAPPSP